VKVLFDTNVLIDFLLDREPWADDAARVLSYVERGSVQGFTCATSVATVFYLARKAGGVAQARKHVRALLSLLQVAPVQGSTLNAALASNVADFEDAVVAEAASQTGADVVVTRDPMGFKGSPLPAHSPGDFLALLQSR